MSSHRSAPENRTSSSEARTPASAATSSAASRTSPVTGTSATPSASGSTQSSPASDHTSTHNNKSLQGRDNSSTLVQSPPLVRYGKCKWFNVAKGWGFITPNDGGTEVFVHQSVIQMKGFRSLGAQEDVEFESIETPRGVEATRVAGREGLDCVGSSVRPRPQSRFVRRVRCYNCNKFNHIAAECKLEPQPRRCYLCQKDDHLIADCKNK